MAIIDCGSGSTFIASNKVSSLQDLYLDGFLIKLPGYNSYTLACVGTMDVTTSSSNVGLTVIPSPSASIDFSGSFSFLAGLLVALAFVYATLKKW